MFPPYSARFITEKIIQFPEIGESHEKFLSSYSFFQSIIKTDRKRKFPGPFHSFSESSLFRQFYQLYLWLPCYCEKRYYNWKFPLRWRFSMNNIFSHFFHAISYLSNYLWKSEVKWCYREATAGGVL